MTAALQNGPDGDGSILSGAKALESCAYLAQSMLAHNFRDPANSDDLSRSGRFIPPSSQPSSVTSNSTPSMTTSVQSPSYNYEVNAHSATSDYYNSCHSPVDWNSAYTPPKFKVIRRIRTLSISTIRIMQCIIILLMIKMFIEIEMCNKTFLWII